MSIPTVLPFSAVSAADLPIVGGKGANLGEMTRAGFPIPPGFCITTAGYQDFLAACPSSNSLYEKLDALDQDHLDDVRQIGREIRDTLLVVPIPDQLQQAILAAWQKAGPDNSYAVRSSATAEDLPDASFAGQQDTFLNVRGADELLDKVRRCWISLFTDRAILYRIRNHFSHREVLLSVVVQQMVKPEVSGILFTADPVSGHRHMASIDASYGLGEALVAGLVNPDLYKVDKRTNQLIEIQIGDKQLAIRPAPDGGTYQETIEGSARHEPVLTHAQAIELAQLGTRIETHYGRPQDIEWALADGRFHILQSRPITTLYPLPQPAPTDTAFRIYFSFGHAQVMTDPMPPFSISIWRILFAIGKKSRPLDENEHVRFAAGRIYIDMTPPLHAHLPHRLLPRIMTVADPLSAQILTDIIQRPEFEKRPPPEKSSSLDPLRWVLPLMRQAMLNLWWRQPEGTIERINQYMARITAERRAQMAAAQPGLERLQLARHFTGNALLEDALPLAPYIMSGMFAQQMLLRLAKRHNVAREAEATMRGLSGNVTTEMDLAVGDLADAARQSPQLVNQLQNGDIEAALETAASDPAARLFHQALQQFLGQYGMRGPSEIDIARPRWGDDPGSLLRMVAGNLGHKEAGNHRAHHQKMAREGEAAADKLEAAVRHGLLGRLRARLVRRLVRVGRNHMAAREHPKFLIIQIMGLVRTAVLEAAEMLVEDGRLDAVEDVWYLSLPELIGLFEKTADAPTVANPRLIDPRPLIAQRQADYCHYAKLTPPRIITSDGETPTAQLKRDGVPEGALVGTPVSPGIVEGIARVVLDPTKETVQPGEILVAPFTDPGWTPLFINAAGLVMEVGGLMTHGSVVAREYGIPAVVAVPGATTRIETGQRIRVNGDGGFVELLG